MTVPTLHCIKDIPAASRAAANAGMNKAGWGPNTYSVPVSVTGLEPAEFYFGCCPEYETQAAQVDDIRAGRVRPSGMTQVEADAIAKSRSAREPLGQRSPRDHFEAVLAARGLTEIVPVDLL